MAKEVPQAPEPFSGAVPWLILAAEQTCGVATFRRVFSKAMEEATEMYGETQENEWGGKDDDPHNVRSCIAALAAELDRYLTQQNLDNKE